MMRLLPWLFAFALALAFFWLAGYSLRHTPEVRKAAFYDRIDKEFPDHFAAGQPGEKGGEVILYTREPDGEPQKAGVARKAGEQAKHQLLYHPKTEKERAEIVADIWHLHDGNFEIGSLE